MFCNLQISQIMSMQNAIYIWERLVRRESNLFGFWCGNLCQAVRPRLWQNWWSGLHVRAVNVHTHLYTWRQCSLTSAPSPLLVWYVCTCNFKVCAADMLEAVCTVGSRRKATLWSETSETSSPVFPVPSSDTSVCPQHISCYYDEQCILGIFLYLMMCY